MTSTALTPKPCVIGQLFGEYDVGLTALGAPALGTGRWDAEHGFIAVVYDQWMVLDATWVALLKERFDTGNLSDA